MSHISLVPPQQAPSGLWTQAEAAKYLGVSVRYLRDSACPKVLLPGNGGRGQPLVRYNPVDVMVWAKRWCTDSRGSR